MSVKKIVQPPNPILNHVCKSVTNLEEIKILVDDLIDTLYNQVNPLGVGLSAPQIGIDARVFVVRLPEDGVQVIVNPEVLEVSKEMTTPVANRKFLEGCLSLPDKYGEVTRFQWIKIKYLSMMNDNFVSKTRKVAGFESRVYQHELDHLNGILFTERIKEQDHKLYKLEIHDNEEVLVEIENK